jgi:hypothetical protein
MVSNHSRRRLDRLEEMYWSAGSEILPLPAGSLKLRIGAAFGENREPFPKNSLDPFRCRARPVHRGVTPSPRAPVRFAARKPCSCNASRIGRARARTARPGVKPASDADPETTPAAGARVQNSSLDGLRLRDPASRRGVQIPLALRVGP